jgi:hypothetical protein
MRAVLVFLVLLAAPATAAEIDVLLVGNSYTAFNNLASLTSTALGAHDAVDVARVEAHAPGGVRLPQHLAEADGTNGETQLRGWLNDYADGWEVVVFQDQSQVPGFYELDVVFDESEAAFVELDRLAEAAPGGPATVLYMTWGRRDGDSQNANLFPDFLTMQARLEEGYRRYAEAADRAVYTAPVGVAFKAVYDAVVAVGETPTDADTCFFRLYDGDGSHPSPAGSWVAAAVLSTIVVGARPPAQDDVCGDVWADAVDSATEGWPQVPLELATPADDDDAANDDDAADDDDADTEYLGDRDAVGCGCATGARTGGWLLMTLVFTRRRCGVSAGAVDA